MLSFSIFSQEKNNLETESKNENLDEPKKNNSTKFIQTGLGRGLKLTSEDSLFSIKIRARIQVRYAEQIVPSDRKKDKDEFEVRRLRLAINGNLFGNDWAYVIQLGFAKSDMEDPPVPIRDAQIIYNKYKNFRINMGQMKVPFNRQRLNSSSALQMVDRSIVNAELNLDRDVGIKIFSTDLFGFNKKFGYDLGIYQGNGRNRTSKKSGLLYVGRFSFSPLGKMEREEFDEKINEIFSESDLGKTKLPKLSISASIAYNKNTDRPLSTIGTPYQFAYFDYLHHSLDFIFKWQGFSLTGEYLRRVANVPYKEKEDIITGSLIREYSRSVHGFFFQGGYLLPLFFEISLRYGEYKPIGNTDPSIKFSREQGIGLSKYFLSHNLKLQADYFWITGTPATNDKSHQFRIQMQVYY